jgi:hypothetical protein
LKLRARVTGGRSFPSLNGDFVESDGLGYCSTGGDHVPSEPPYLAATENNVKASFDVRDIDALEARLQRLTRGNTEQPEILWGVWQVAYRRI